MATLDEYIGVKNEEHEMLVYSNWFTQWYNACINAGLDPDEIMENEIKVKRKKKRK